MLVVLAPAVWCVRWSPPDSGGAPTSYDILPSVAMSATVEREQSAPLILRARVRFSNRGRDTVRFATGDDWCTLTVRAYAEDVPGGAARRGALVWSSDQPPAPGEGLIGCSQVLRRVRLPPGRTDVFEATYRPSLQIGRPLRPGRYRFTVSVHLDEPRRTTTPEVAAGSLLVEE